MNVDRNGDHILSQTFGKDCIFFGSPSSEDVIPPCAPEKSVELCFHCIEGVECEEHPSRRKMQSGIVYFADDDFNLVDSHQIKNLHWFCDEEEFINDAVDQKEIAIKQEPFEQEQAGESSILWHFNGAPTKRSIKSEEHFHEKVMQVSEIPRKRFSRFREKAFVCDVCDAAFTLKQNVQSHLFIYHMQKDGSLKQHTRLMYKCDSCEKVPICMDPQLAAHNGVFSLILQRMMLEAHAANGAILSHFGHVYPAGKDVAMPLLPLPRNEPPKTLDSLPPWQSWRKDSVRAHKRQNLEMKISLLKKRKEQQVLASHTNGAHHLRRSDDEIVCKEEAHVGCGEDCEFSSNGSDVKRECTVDAVGGAESDKETSSEQVFKSPHAADVHFKKAHKKPIVKPPTDCDECGKRFASAFQLREHISIQHLKERNFVCEECGQKFGRRGGLRRHVQMVHQNHLHMCPYEGCDHPGYKCSKALTAHIRSVHTNVRPYVCDTCGKAFVRRNDLKMHTLTHTTETAFHCECGSKFRRLIYLKKHQRLCLTRNGDSTCDTPEAIDDPNDVDEDSNDFDL